MEEIDKNKHLPQTYISTPYAYTKLSKNLSLLQQSMLNKVSEHLQGYIQYYYGSDLKNSHEKPRPLFSKAEKNSGLPDFTVSYAELGVDIANYNVARKAIKEVLELTIEAPWVDKDGNESMKYQLIFSSANASSIASNGVVFTLNPAVVDWVFDMSQGYVRHPADIARIGQVERMPMMYYFLFKKSEKWKYREVHLTVLEIKDYLGLLKTIKEGSSERAGRKLKNCEPGEIKEAYPKFSQFKKNVLETSVNDINRLRKEGLLDICVSYEPVYNGKRKVGNPAFIKFCIYDSIEDMRKATQQHPQQQTMIFADEKPGEKEWQKLLSILKDPVVEYLKPLPLFSYDGKSILIAATKEQMNEVEKHLSQESVKAIHECMKKVFGKQINFSYKLTK